MTELHPLANLPWLFYTNARQKNLSCSSSCDTFSPINAAGSSGNAWQSTTTPSAKPGKRSIVLTANGIPSDFRNPPNSIDLLATIEWLRRDGFEVYLCVPDVDGKEAGKNKFHRFEGHQDFHYLSCLSDFDETDHNILGQQVARDQAVVLDALQFHKINSCLNEEKRVPNSNAVCTATTLRFNHYPSEIKNMNDLAAHLRIATEEEAMTLLEHNRELIEKSNSINDCLAASQSLAVVQKLIEIVEDKIDGLEELADFFKISTPEIAEPLVEQYKHGIKNHADLCALLSAPITGKLASKLITEHEDKILVNYLHKIVTPLRTKILTPPTLLQDLIKKYAAQIEGWNDAYQFACSESGTTYPVIAQTILSSSDQIREAAHDGYWLAVNLIASPTNAKKLIHQHGNKISSPAELEACLKACPHEASLLIKHYENAGKIKTIHALQVCLAGCVSEHEAKKLIEQYGDQFIRNVADLIECLEKCPAIVEYWVARYPEIKLIEAPGLFRLNRYLSLSPAGIDRFLSAFSNAIPFERFEDFSSTTKERYFSSQLSLDDLFAHRQDNIPWLLNPANLDNITSLFITSPNAHTKDTIFSLIGQGKLKNVSVIEVPFCADEALDNLSAILSALHGIKAENLLVFLPQDLQDKDIAWPAHDYCYTDFQKFKMEDSSEQKTHAEVLEEKDAQQNKHPAAQKKPTKTLFSAVGNLDSEFGVENRENSTFTMAPVGEVLNADFCGPKPRIRTGIIDINLVHDASVINLEQAYREPTLPPHKASSEVLLRPINAPPLLDQSAFQRLLDEKSQLQEGIYAKLSTQLLANTSTRLWSIDAAEELLALHAEPHTRSPIEIQKGDDGFYYATATQNCVLDYVVKAETEAQQKARYDAIPADNPIKETIESYLRNPKYRPTAPANEKIPPIENNDVDGWLEKLFTNCIGVCRHRVLAVHEHIKKHHPEMCEKIRMVAIDRAHVRLEIEAEKDHWVQVDLGGRQANQIYSDHKNLHKQQPKTHKKPIPSIKPALQKIKTTKKEESAFLKSWKKKTAPKIIDNQHSLRFIVTGHTSSIILCTPSDTQQLDAQANFFLRQAHRIARPVFYLDHPKKLEVHKRRVVLDRKGNPHLQIESQFSKFLEQATQNPESAPVLLVNWDAFNDQERLRLNTLLDQRSVRGLAIPPYVQIISLCTRLPEDSSFTSRHQLRLDTTRFNPPELTCKADGAAPEIIIDLEGLSNWEEALFGKVVQHQKKLAWRKSAFIDLLQNPATRGTLKIINASHPAALTYALNQASALGKFIYCGLDIPWPAQVDITADQKPFDFSCFKTPFIQTNVKKESASSDIEIVSTHRFDFLLADKKIVNRAYEEIAGVIENHKNRSLSLFVTSPLTEAQWYCLLHTAQKYNVQLELSLAPHVSLPCNLNLQNPQKIEESKEEYVPPKGHVVYLTNDPDSAEQEIKASFDTPLVLHVEDYHFGNLIYRLDYTETEKGFENFQVIKSDVLAALEKGRDVILRGEFSEGLLAELQPLLLGQTINLPTGEKIQITGKLACVVDSTKKVNLEWLASPPLYTSMGAANKNTKPKKPTVIYDESSEDFKKGYTAAYQLERSKQGQAPNPNDTPFEANLDHASEKAAAFMAVRKKAVLEKLETNHIIQMVGESAVGKSRLIQQIEKDHPDTVTVYYGFSSMEAWANDKSGKTKILFLDEINMEDQELTSFEPLKPGGSQEILIKEKLAQLDDRYKVIGARNSTHYKGGRVEQKLFRDNRIPELHFYDFPDAYIYEYILKPLLIGDMSEEDCISLATPLIANYRAENGKWTVRELQEQALKIVQQRKDIEIFYSLVCSDEKNVREEKEEKKSDFVPTQSQANLIDQMGLFIRIRQSGRAKNISFNGVGLNGFLIEGKPSTGKTEVIRDALQQAGYQITPDFDAQNAFLHDQNWCYKIDADLPLDEKKRIIIHAFEEAHAIWLDELDSCIDEGLAAILNAVLTGMHPDTHKAPKKSGFMAFFTGNGAGFLGRSLIGPDVRHRNNQAVTSDYKKEELPGVFKNKFLNISDRSREKKANEFFALQEEANYTLRGYLGDVENIEADRQEELDQQAGRLNDVGFFKVSFGGAEKMISPIIIIDDYYDPNYTEPH